MKDKLDRYICKICKKLTNKKDLDRCDGMCDNCWDKQDIYQVFKNGKYKKLEMENLWDWLSSDVNNELYGIFLMIYKNHNRIAIARIDGGVDSYNEYLETDLFPVHVKTMCKILKLRCREEVKDVK